MTQFLHDWVMRIAAVTIISACALALAPEGAPKRSMKLVCAIISLMTLLSPLGSIDLSFAADAFSRYKSAAAEFTDDFAAVNEKITQSIIEDETEAYISDKGVQLGVRVISVNVTALKKEDGLYYPYSTQVKCEGGKSERLGEYIQNELGIEKDRIIWQ